MKENSKEGFSYLKNKRKKALDKIGKEEYKDVEGKKCFTNKIKEKLEQEGETGQMFDDPYPLEDLPTLKKKKKEEENELVEKVNLVLNINLGPSLSKR